MHPHFIRLSVDLDPAGNPIGIHVSAKDHKRDQWQALWVATPEPFDGLAGAWADLVTGYQNLGVEQIPLW